MLLGRFSEMLIKGVQAAVTVSVPAAAPRGPRGPVPRVRNLNDSESAGRGPGAGPVQPSVMTLNLNFRGKCVMIPYMVNNPAKEMARFH